MDDDTTCMRSLIPDKIAEELDSLQMEVALKGIPVAVIFEGGSGRVISRVINELDRDLEPMGIRYHHYDATVEGTGAFADMLQATPGKGEIVLFDRSWYSMAIRHSNGDEDAFRDEMRMIQRFEEYLVDNGTYLIKIGLNITHENLRKYANEYRSFTALNKTYLSVDQIDRVKFRVLMPEAVKLTDTKRTPWNIIDVGEVQETLAEVAGVLCKRLSDCIKDDWHKKKVSDICLTYPNPRKGLDLDVGCKDYRERMDALSDELERLQILLALSGRSLILGFEGWDAAGKGGAIKHVCHALNPRGYSVARIKAPTEEDNAHTYLWRFARSLPRAGYVSIFDRTWYGRMMVEPIEGFCDDDEYCRSADEINTFEKILTQSGGIVLKFWLDIDKDTQLERFNERKNDPLKQWKLTDEDWRNRDKWDRYEEFIDAMISSTNTPYAPWIVVPANNKKAARVFVLERIVETLRRELLE